MKPSKLRHTAETVGDFDEIGPLACAGSFQKIPDALLPNILQFVGSEAANLTATCRHLNSWELYAKSLEHRIRYRKGRGSFLEQASPAKHCWDPQAIKRAINQEFDFLASHPSYDKYLNGITAIICRAHSEERSKRVIANLASHALTRLSALIQGLRYAKGAREIVLKTNSAIQTMFEKMQQEVDLINSTLGQIQSEGGHSGLRRMRELYQTRSNRLRDFHTLRMNTGLKILVQERRNLRNSSRMLTQEKVLPDEEETPTEKYSPSTPFMIME